MTGKPRQRRKTALELAMECQPPSFNRRASYFTDCGDEGDQKRRSSDNYSDLQDTWWIPDWRDKAHYEGLVTKDKARVAWEFLRRNRKYQIITDDLLRFQDIRLGKSNQSSDYDDYAERDQLRRILRGGLYWFEGMFGTNSLTNYRQSSTPNFVDSSMIKAYRIIKDGKDRAHISEDMRYGYEGWMADGELVVRLNLYTSVDSQFSKLRKEISVIKEENHIPKKNYTDSGATQKLVQHLRLLDIYATSGSRDHMNEVIGENAYNGKYTAANTNLETAIKMANRGYRSLLVSE